MTPWYTRFQPYQRVERRSTTRVVTIQWFPSTSFVTTKPTPNRPFLLEKGMRCNGARDNAGRISDNGGLRSPGDNAAGI